MKFVSLLLAGAMASLSMAAQTDTSAKAAAKKWDVNNPQGLNYKDVSFTVSEGTWMNVDISPKGDEVVFDLLGDIYILPIAGGTARVLRQGLAYEVQPRFSPDGNKILFTSDAGGGDNIWVMDKNGSNARQITKESFRLLNNAVWSPDGNYIIARKHFTSGRSLGAGEIWLYHIAGGDGVQLTKRKNDQQDVNEPSASKDGKYIYYSEDVYPGGFFQYNKDPNNQIYVIRRYDRESGEIETVTGGGGSAFRPQISPNGELLAFVRRVRTKSVLYLRNMQTGEEWPVYDQLSKDQQEAWAIFGVYTGFAWMPDGKEMVVWANGKINRIAVDGKNQATAIPFTCNVQQKIADVVRFKQNINPDKATTHVLRNVATAPGGKYVVYNALGVLWKKDLPNGAVKRLTNSTTDIEDEPIFSKDGKLLVYISWNDSAMGHIHVLDIAKGTDKKVNIGKGIFRNPAISPDGKYIVYDKDDGDNVLGNSFNVNTGIYIAAIDGGSQPKRIVRSGSQPYFDGTGAYIYYQQGRKSLGVCKLDGTEQKTLVTSTYGSQYKVSPDGNWIAFVDLHKVYIAAFPKSGKLLEISGQSSAVPVKLVAKDAGYSIHWNANSEALHYTLGNEYFTIPLKPQFAFLNNDKTTIAKADSVKGISIGFDYVIDKPKGVVVFTNARIITMDNDQVIENGSLIVENNLIKEIGTGLSIPAGAKVVDCGGKTIMPGFVDAHGHAVHFRSGITPQKHWPYYTNLAYGVTTIHDPSANSEMVFGQSEMVKAGKMIGPRVFSTGTILYGADGDFKAVINSLEDARSAIRRTKAFGAFSVKSYNQPRREQNQQVILAAKEQGVLVVPEGGSFFYHNMAMINDGHTTIEHNIPIAVLHDDVIQLWKRAKTGYTPTHIVNYGSVSGEYYWYQHTNVWEKEKLLRFTPRSVLDTRGRHRTMVPEEEYTNGHILTATSTKKLSDAGVLVNMGAHGQIQGIGAHWEIWMMAQGGMTPMEALKTATINSARSLGLDDWIGSLQKGKLADLIIMDANPLENIRNTESIKYVMVNGRLYDAETMNETGNYNKPRTKFFWELGRKSDIFNWQDGSGHMEMDTD